MPPKRSGLLSHVCRPEYHGVLYAPPTGDPTLIICPPCLCTASVWFVLSDPQCRQLIDALHMGGGSFEVHKIWYPVVSWRHRPEGPHRVDVTFAEGVPHIELTALNGKRTLPKAVLNSNDRNTIVKIIPILSLE